MPNACACAAMTSSSTCSRAATAFPPKPDHSWSGGSRVCSNISMFRRAGMLAFCVYPILSAGLVRVEVSERTDVLQGKPFGNTGPYERIVGKAYFAIDPKLAANQIITDIDKAPCNDEGKVEFSADPYVLKPRDPNFGNGAVLFEVSNRGRKGMLSMYNRAAGSTDP